MATNQYKAWCAHCKAEVPPGEGVLRGKNEQGRWIVEHEVCPPSANKLAAIKQQSPDNQKRTPGQPKGVKKISATKPDRPPTAEQQACVDLFATGQSLVIQAGAGTGKTFTLRLLAWNALERLPDAKGLYTAFNTDIVKDTAGTMPSNVRCSTVHKLAHDVIVKGTNFINRLDPNKNPKVSPYETARRLGAKDIELGDNCYVEAVQVASIAVQTVKKFCQTADRNITYKHVPYVEGIDLPTEDGKRTYTNNKKLAKKIAPLASRVWADVSDENGHLFTFEHEYYLKLWQLSNPVLPYDFILFDESQDANPLMSAVIDAQTHAQRVYVGDSNQAIYEFTGAVNSIKAQMESGVPTRQLTQSFRFGPAVAEHANAVLTELGTDLRLTGFDQIDSKSGKLEDHELDCILTRTNATAVECLFVAQENGVKARLNGKSDDIIKFCKAAEKLQQGKTTLHHDLGCFHNWDEVVAYAKSEDGSDLRTQVNLIERFGTATIIEAIENQPSEQEADLIISTAHKAKGREWGHVRIASDFVPKPGKDGQPRPRSESENRLLYVALTRAQLHLDATALDTEGRSNQDGETAQNEAQEV